MVRARFTVRTGDYLPPRHPRHPYWCAGKDEYTVSVVAYVEDEAELLRQWPQARDIEMIAASKYLFTDRFPRPEWFKD